MDFNDKNGTEISPASKRLVYEFNNSVDQVYIFAY